MVSVDPAFWVSLFGWFWLKISDVTGFGANSKAALLTYLAHWLGRLAWLGLGLLGLRGPSLQFL